MIFWAEAEEAPYTVTFADEIEDANMVVSYDNAVCNDENRDAFYCVKEINVQGAQTETIELKRPFAQLNIGTSDYAASASAGFTPTQSAVTVKGVYTTLNFNAEGPDGIATNATDATFAAANIKKDETFPVSGNEYLAMTYVLVDGDKENFDIEFTYANDKSSKTRTVGSVPMQRNYRTNIYGKILTSEVDVNVEIKPGYDGTENHEVVEVATAEELATAVENNEVGEIVLTNNIELDQTLVFAAPSRSQIATRNVVLDLNGKTITTNSDNGSTTNHLYAIINYVDLTIKNGTINARGNKNYGKMTIEDKVTINAIDGNGGYGVINYDGAEFIMNGGTIATTLEDDGQVDKGGYDATTLRVEAGAKATINGGTINNICDYTFALDNDGEVIVNGGEFTSIHSTVSSSGTMTINGGSFTCNGLEGITAHALVVWDGSVTTINGGTFDGKDNYNGFNVDADKGAIVYIKGGEFLSVHSGSLYGEGTIIVSGGTFFDKVPEARLAEGYKAVESNGVYTVVANGVIATAAEFIAAVNSVEDGGTIKLGANIDFTTEEGGRSHNSGTWYDGIYYVGDKSFTIDLGGFTVGNAKSAVNDYLLNFKNVGDKANTITIKNGTVDAGTAAFCALCTSGTQQHQLTINLENITLYNNISNGSTAKVRGGVILNVNAGTKIIGKNSYLAIENYASTVNIYEGAELYMNGTASYNGCLAGVGGGGIINVYGGFGKGVKGGFIAMTSGGTINVSGGEWIANTDGTIGDNSNLYVLTAQSNKYESGFAGSSIINVTGGTFRGGMDAWVLNNIEGEKAELNIGGGNFNTNPTHYLVEGKTATEANGIWTVQ